MCENGIVSTQGEGINNKNDGQDPQNCHLKTSLESKDRTTCLENVRVKPYNLNPPKNQILKKYNNLHTNVYYKQLVRLGWVWVGLG